LIIWSSISNFQLFLIETKRISKILGGGIQSSSDYW